MCVVEYPFPIGRISQTWNDDNQTRFIITEPPVEVQLLQNKIKELEDRIKKLEERLAKE